MCPIALVLLQAYSSRCRGRAPVFPELPVQYADYTLWQRAVLGEESDPGSVMAQQISFWRAALAGAPEELWLPADYPRPAAPSYRGGEVPVRIESGLHRRLLELGPARGAPRVM